MTLGGLRRPISCWTNAPGWSAYLNLKYIQSRFNGYSHFPLKCSTRSSFCFHLCVSLFYSSFCPHLIHLFTKLHIFGSLFKHYSFLFFSHHFLGLLPLYFILKSSLNHSRHHQAEEWPGYFHRATHWPGRAWQLGARAFRVGSPLGTPPAGFPAAALISTPVFLARLDIMMN